jgi:glycosyltransferase involved in cell wall biosynthesis
LQAAIHQPLVSVIVPAYNAQRTISATLQSIITQSISDFEVIVVDDGSTDRTREIADSTGDERVRVLRQANAGHAAARNTGIADARGKYIAVLDADDIWLPHKLERQLSVFRSAPHVRAQHAAAIHVDDDLRPLFIGRCQDGKNRLFDVLCFRGLPGVMCTLIAERSLLEEVGGFDASLIILQDWDLAIKLARRGELYSSSEPLVLYRVHAGNQSKKIDLHIEPGERILANVFGDPDLPAEVAAKRRYVYARFYAMLAGGALQLGRLRYALYWSRRAIRTHPGVIAYLASLPVRRVHKRRSRKEAVSISWPSVTEDGPRAGDGLASMDPVK